MDPHGLVDRGLCCGVSCPALELEAGGRCLSFPLDLLEPQWQVGGRWGEASALLFISTTDALSSVWVPRRHCASGPRAEVPVLPTAETRLAVSLLPGWGGGSLSSGWDLRI